MQNISNYIKHPNCISIAIFPRTCKWLPDRLYLQLLFFLHFGRFINLKNPKTFSEKLQWLKLYNRRPEYTQLVDKYAVKQYVANKIGEEHIIPTIGVWNRPEDIDFDNLPNSFVLKTTHSGGCSGVVICKDKSKLDINAAIIKINKSLKTDIYKSMREWPYKNVARKIIAENYIEDETGELADYKFFCFNGIPLYCQVIKNRFVKETIDFFDSEWNHLPFIGLKSGINNNQCPIERPFCLKSMLKECKKLSQGIPFVRIDFYIIGNYYYFGEITFFPASGLGRFHPNEWNYKIGDLLKLPL